jgi:hypothetical protein
MKGRFNIQKVCIFIEFFNSRISLPLKSGLLHKYSDDFPEKLKDEMTDVFYPVK